MLYHSDAFASDSRYGLCRYSWELYESLISEYPELRLVPFSSRGNLGEQQLRSLTEGTGFVKPGWKHRLLVMAWANLAIPKIERWCIDTDVVHTVEMDYPVATTKPWIVTVHDLGPLSHPQFFSESRPWLRRAGIKRAIDRADIIVAVSKATANAIEVVASGSLGDRLRIVPEGVSSYFYEPADMTCLDQLQDIPAESQPFYLWTGSLNPRKNLENVLDAYEKIAAGNDQALVIAGGLGWDSHTLIDRIDKSQFRDRIFRPGFVSDDQLKALYRKATAFIYVSLMEGFGLPILEAMACGCPVITSDISSMPEVSGEAGILVDPYTSDAIAAAMTLLADDDSYRQKMKQKGIERSRQFTWKKCASRMAELYAEIS